MQKRIEDNDDYKAPPEQMDRKMFLRLPLGVRQKLLKRQAEKFNKENPNYYSEPKPDESRLLSETALRKLHPWLESDSCIGCLNITCKEQRDLTARMKDAECEERISIVVESIFKEIEKDLHVEYMLRMLGKDIQGCFIIGKIKDKVKALKSKRGVK